jgi:hypothetical protein
MPAEELHAKPNCGKATFCNWDTGFLKFSQAGKYGLILFDHSCICSISLYTDFEGCGNYPSCKMSISTAHAQICSEIGIFPAYTQLLVLECERLLSL